jgi:integrase
MLTLYRLHKKTCVEAGGAKSRYDRTYRRCQCPIHVEGLVGRQKVRESLGHANWKAAQLRVAEAEGSGRWGSAMPEKAPQDAPPVPPEPIGITFSDAKSKFLKDIQFGRQLSSKTYEKYELLLRRLEEFCAARGLTPLTDLTLEQLREFREGWEYNPLTSMKKLELLKAFFRFCVDSNWIPTNPAKAIRPPRPKENPIQPFTPDEYTRILAAPHQIPLAMGTTAADSDPIDAEKLVTFIMLLRYSGLRIGDAGLLTIDRIQGDKLFLYTQKTGTHVYVPLPPVLVTRLRSIRLRHGKYLFVGPSSMDVDVVAEVWRRKLARVFTKAGIVGGHPHRFRHTFAVEYLKGGGKIENLSILMGHSSVRITERHYASWVRDRQDLLEAEIRGMWRGLEVEGVATNEKTGTTG